MCTFFIYKIKNQTMLICGIHGRCEDWKSSRTWVHKFLLYLRFLLPLPNFISKSPKIILPTVEIRWHYSIQSIPFCSSTPPPTSHTRSNFFHSIRMSVYPILYKMAPSSSVSLYLYFRNTMYGWTSNNYWLVVMRDRLDRQPSRMSVSWKRSYQR